MRREGKKKRVFLVPAIRSSLFGMICYQDHLWRRNDDRLPCKELLIYFETKRTFVLIKVIESLQQHLQAISCEGHCKSCNSSTTNCTFALFMFENIRRNQYLVFECHLELLAILFQRTTMSLCFRCHQKTAIDFTWYQQ